MGKAQWFWWLLTAACLTWYSTITVYVAIRGAKDIRQMLRRLAASDRSDRSDPSDRSDASDGADV